MNTAPAVANPDIGSSAYAETFVKPASNWFTPPRFALLLALLIAAFFAAVIFGGQTFFYRDYGGFGYPLAKYHRDCFWRGELPVWNSLSACGLPFLAQWNTMTLYPGSLIYLLLPLPWSLSFFCLAHLFLAGLGMYFLAFRWTKNHFAAAVAGVAFSFNGLTLNSLMYPNNIAALGLMPWVVLQMEAGWRQGGRALALASLVGALQMLSGAPEIILFTWFIILVLAIGKLKIKELPPLPLFSRTALVLGLVLCLSAAQLLPFIDLLMHSERDSKSALGTGAMPIWGWINLVLPLFRSIRSAQDVYFQARQEWTSSYYPGIGVLLLALLSFRSPEKHRVKLLWAVAALGLVLALGPNGYVYTWLYKVCPFLGFMRLPVKFVVLAIFAMPLLSAIALARANTSVGTADCKLGAGKKWVITVSAALIAVIAGALWFSYSHPYWNLAWSDLVQNGIVRTILLALFATAFLRLGSAEGARRNWVRAAFLLGLVLDVWTHMPNQNPTIPSAAYQKGLTSDQFDSKCRNGQARAMLAKPTWDFLYTTIVPDPLPDYTGRRAALFGNCNLLDAIPTPDGFYSMYLFEQRQIWSKLFFVGPTNFPAPLADFVGISQLGTNLFGWQPRPSARPLVTAGARPEFLDRKETLKHLAALEFNPSQTVYLPLEARSGVSVTNQSSPRVLNTIYRSGHITTEVDASEPALLTVAESYHSGWRASVNGKTVTIWRANHAFQALEIQAGRSQVKLIYKERHLLPGSVISLSTLLGCLFVCFRRRGAPPAREATPSKSDSERPAGL